MSSVKALTSVSHGHHNLDEGQVYHDLPADVIHTLTKMGFVEAHKGRAKKDEAPADEDLSDLVGGKMDDAEVQNKMEKAPANKGKK